MSGIGRLQKALLLLLVASALAACGGGSESKVASARGKRVDPSKWPADDQSLCYSASLEETGGLDYRSAGFEVDTIASEQTTRPNLRRIHHVLGEPGSAHRTLVCREVDTNLDGIKDVVRFYDAKGAPLSEKGDRNFDGVADVWITFLDAKVVEVAEDTTRSAGRANEWRTFADGQLTRVRRDRNGDGKPDQWESYADGKLERVGVDEDGDGKVDRWDRDEVLRLEQEHALGRPAAASGSSSGSADASPASSESSASDAGVAPAP